MLKLGAKPVPLVIIQVCALTSEGSEEALEECYEDIKKAMSQAKSTYMVIVMGNLNVKIGAGKNGEVAGSFG